MNPKTVSEIRESFLQYFQEKSHSLVPSSSLIPAGDPTLLFTTAGMVQFKPYFTGAVELPFTRATSAQKCLRTTDLENVGQTERHCTFFEMLGNFSFGDYFKKEAIHYALEFSIRHLGIPEEKIWITIFENDDEAKQMWLDEGIPGERIVRLGKADNFWGPAGDSGACGPCSELYLDRGKEKGYPDCGNKPSCKPGCDCDRFMEYWNLVFNQFNQTVSGEFLPLKQTGIDTGAGVERIAMLLQEVDSVYDTDEFKKLLAKISELSRVEYGEESKIPFRVIADHSRSVFFAIGDSIYPDRTGRGYVIRRLLRRAALFARKLGIREPFIFRLVDTLSEVYGSRYPELIQKKEEIRKILLSEEELFLHTLELGLEELESITARMEKEGSRVLTGRDSFRLYGTFGFPKEMTQELVMEKGIEFDEASFEEELEKDRNLSRESWKGKSSNFLTGLDAGSVPATEFLGYSERKASGKVAFLFTPTAEKKDSVATNEEAVVVLDRTPFYAESGGQIADQGFLKADGVLFRVTDVQKENDTFLHIGSVLRGSLSVNLQVEAEIDSTRRGSLAAHHSGTHLMHSALRNILGEHVRQKASLVADDYLRFDFSHPQSMTEGEISRVEDFVNGAIQSRLPVTTQVLPIEEAKSSGAIAFFEEKYGDRVRVVKMGEESIEFCGGTHVQNTGDIRFFSVIKESSPGAGNRRIEAVCGNSVVQFYTREFQELYEKVQDYNLRAKEFYSTSSQASPNLIQREVPDPKKVEESFSEKGSAMVAEYRKLKRQILEEYESKNAKLFKEKKKKEAEDFQNNPSLIQELVDSSEEVGEFRVVEKVFEDVEAKSLKELADGLKSRMENVIVLFGSRSGESATLVFMCNQASVKKGIHCGNLLKESMEVLGGRGGGKPDMAQGGGKNPEQLKEAIALAVSKIPS